MGDGYSFKSVNNTSQLTNLSFEIVTDKSVLKPGDTLNISIRVTNTGWENITLSWSNGSYHEQDPIYHPNFLHMGFVVEGPMGRVAGGVGDSILQALSSIVFEPNQTDVFNYTWDQGTYSNLATGLITGDYTIKAVIGSIHDSPAQTTVYIEVSSEIISPDLALFFIITAVAVTISIAFFLMVRSRKKP